MPNLELPILVVDDAKFSSTIIGKTLKMAGYRDVRFANDAPTALKMMEERPVSVLVADWLMPQMDGLELASHTRQLDEQINHFTYIILLTAKESMDALAEAFDRGVDDFVFKSEMSKQLLPRVYAADRIADLQNSLLIANQLLMDNNKELESQNVIDLETGLGNHRLAEERLRENLRHAEARGGACSYYLIGIKNWQELKRRHSPVVLEEISVGIARRLRHLTRPMDSVCRVGENQYVVIAHFQDVDNCTPGAYRRIHEGINYKAFKTSAGFISIVAGSSVCAVKGNQDLPENKEVEGLALSKLQYAYDTGTISVALWQQKIHA